MGQPRFLHHVVHPHAMGTLFAQPHPRPPDDPLVGFLLLVFFVAHPHAIRCFRSYNNGNRREKLQLSHDAATKVGSATLDGRLTRPANLSSTDWNLPWTCSIHIAASIATCVAWCG